MEEEVGVSSWPSSVRSHGLMLPQLAFIARETRGWIEGGREKGGEIAKLETQEMQKVDEFPLLGRGKGSGMGIAQHNHNRINFPLDICAKQTGSLHSSAKAVFCNFLWNVLSRKDITEPPPSPSRGHPFLLLLLHLPREKLLFLSSLIYRNRIPTSISLGINLLSPTADDVSWRLL